MKLRIAPPIFSLLCVLTMYGTSKLLPATILLFPGQNIIAFLFIIPGLFLDIIAAIQFRKHTTTISPFSPDKTASIVKNGVFAISRNPMYLGLLLVLIGITFLFGSPINIFILIIFSMVITHLQIKPEEEILEAKFGDVYAAYRDNVRRWI